MSRPSFLRVLQVALCLSSDACEGAVSSPQDPQAREDAGNTSGRTVDAGHDAASISPDAHVSSLDGSLAEDAATPDAGAVRPGYTLTWSDEFNGPNGTGIDTSKWTAAVDGNGHGNHERQYYSDSLDNAHLEDGQLLIVATTKNAASHTCWYGPCSYTSARFETASKFEVKYGRIEARIQIPYGQGIWPAFWMLGANIATTAWPGCGEIDIMENIGREPSTIHGTIHGPGYSGANGIGSPTMLAGGAKFADAFHVFAVEWEAQAIRFFLDDTLYATRTPQDLPKGAQWVYDHPFYLILNLAVGGDWPGVPDATTQFPQTMRIDYVRVFQKN